MLLVFMSSYHLPSLLELALYKRETFSPNFTWMELNNKSCVFLNLYVNSSGNYPHLFKAHRRKSNPLKSLPNPRPQLAVLLLVERTQRSHNNSSFIFAYQLLPDHSNQEKLLHSYQGIYNQYVKSFQLCAIIF